MFVLFLWYVSNFSPPSTDWLYYPSHLSLSRQLLHSLLFFLNSKTHTHTHFDPSPSYLSQSLWGHLVAVLSNKRLCCISQLNAHLTCQRPLQVSSLWGACRVLTYSGTPTRASYSSDHEWWTVVVISIQQWMIDMSGISLSSLALSHWGV